MSLIAGDELYDLISKGYIDALPEHVNASSIDVRLGTQIKLEKTRGIGYDPEIDISRGGSLAWEDAELGEHGRRIWPGQFFLADTMETFNLPGDISAEFKLRSSVGRSGLNHALAAWVDAGFHGTLTLEFKNMAQAHGLIIRPGMRIGQITFHRHEDAGKNSYALKGRYCGQSGPTTSKGV